MNNQANSTSLRENGFTEAEIERLNSLRNAYESKEKSCVQDNQRRLEFVRWLVITGKLTENLV